MAKRWHKWAAGFLAIILAAFGAVCFILAGSTDGSSGQSRRDDSPASDPASKEEVSFTDFTIEGISFTKLATE